MFSHLSRRALLKGAAITGSGLILPNWGGLAHARAAIEDAKRSKKHCILLWMNGGPGSDLPTFVRMGPCGNAGAGYLGPNFEPFHIDRNGRLPYYTTSYLTPEAEARRADLFRQVEGEFASGHAAEPFDSHRTSKERAWRLLRAKGAFDLSKESDKLKDRYGDSEFARGCLMARRLVEAGIPFVEVGQDNYD